MMLRNIILLMLAFVSQALMAQRQKIDTLIITPNAAVGKVLVSDADGKATWTAAADLTTVDIEGKSNGFIITVNGKKDTFVPPVGTIAAKEFLGLDAAGNIVKDAFLNFQNVDSGAIAPTRNIGFDATGKLVRGQIGTVKSIVACTGASTQVINNPNVTATSTILLNYQDSSRIIYPAILSINPGTSFTVQFSAVPPTTAFLHYTILN
jgi:hypothetical protein